MFRIRHGRDVTTTGLIQLPRRRCGGSNRNFIRRTRSPCGHPSFNCNTAPSLLSFNAISIHRRRDFFTDAWLSGGESYLARRATAATSRTSAIAFEVAMSSPRASLSVSPSIAPVTYQRASQTLLCHAAGNNMNCSMRPPAGSVRIISTSFLPGYVIV